MDRRAFIILGGSILATPFAAEAQQAGKIYRIGFLSSLPVPATAMSDSLRDAGFVEGQNIVIDRRLTEAPEQLPALAEDLVRHQPDVVVAFSNRDVVAAHSVDPHRHGSRGGSSRSWPGGESRPPWGKRNRIASNGTGDRREDIAGIERGCAHS